MTLDERYVNDSTFRQLVDSIRMGLQLNSFTTDDLHAATTMAQQLVRENAAPEEKLRQAVVNARRTEARSPDIEEYRKVQIDAQTAMYRQDVAMSNAYPVPPQEPLQPDPEQG